MILRSKAQLAAFILLASLISWSLPAGAATERELFKYAGQAKIKLDKSKQKQKLRHNWLNVIDRYKRVVKKNPNSRYARNSLLIIGDLYLGLHKRSRLSSDLDESMDYYRRLTKRFPNDHFAGQAQLGIGKIYYYFKKDKDRAYVEFLKVEIKHPQSPQVAEARKWLAKISGSSPRKTRPKETTPAPGGVALVKGIRHWSTATYTRVVIDMDRRISFTDHLLRPDPQLKKPMRLYLDLAQARIKPNMQDVLPIANQLLRQVRVAQYDAKTVRVVLDIGDIETYKIFTLRQPFRLVVDVTGRSTEQTVAKTGVKKVAKIGAKTGSKTPSTPPPLKDLRATADKRKRIPRGLAKKNAKKSSLARQLGLGVRKIVIDPGHGGKDRGAKGKTGLMEKDLTLLVAKELARKIMTNLGIEVILTRNKDVFLPLEERTALANTAGADLFISVHANAHRDSRIYGIETYFLNLATDEEAMRVAARENATSAKNMSDLELILNDLMLNSKITESSQLAKQVQTAMVKNLQKKYRNVKDMGVKQAPFYVLIGANMPSILIEIAFLSNKAEENRMRNKYYRTRLVDGVMGGIKQYTKSIKVAEVR
jgi:N-acetylmuramoyl-L-alanine amidase